MVTQVNPQVVQDLQEQYQKMELEVHAAVLEELKARALLYSKLVTLIGSFQSAFEEEYAKRNR